MRCNRDPRRNGRVTRIEPELWVDRPSEAVVFYQKAFSATILHHVGEGDDIVVQLAVDDARFWVAPASPEMRRLNPQRAGGGTSRTLLVVDDPDAVAARSIALGATEATSIGDEHGWRIARIVDPHGQEWEIGKPLGVWPPSG
jgi:PhnB protein